VPITAKADFPTPWSDLGRGRCPVPDHVNRADARPNPVTGCDNPAETRPLPPLINQPPVVR